MLNRNPATPTPANTTTPAARAATAALIALAVATGITHTTTPGDTQHASKPIPGYGSGV